MYILELLPLISMLVPSGSFRSVVLVAKELTKLSNVDHARLPKMQSSFFPSHQGSVKMNPICNDARYHSNGTLLVGSTTKYRRPYCQGTPE